MNDLRRSRTSEAAFGFVRPQPVADSSDETLVWNDGASPNSRHHLMATSSQGLKNIVLPNLAFFALVWVGFYEHVEFAAWIVYGITTLVAVAYALVAVDPARRQAAAARGMGVSPWVVHVIDITVAAALLAATAYWTAAVWCVGAVLHQFIYRRP